MRHGGDDFRRFSSIRLGQNVTIWVAKVLAGAGGLVAGKTGVTMGGTMGWVIFLTIYTNTPSSYNLFIFWLFNFNSRFENYIIGLKVSFTKIK